MGALNLLSLVNVKRDLSPLIFSLYLNNYSVKTSDDELKDLDAFVKEIQTCYPGIDIYEEIYLGYSINQISKEFDLLRFGNNTVINIELKK